MFNEAKLRKQDLQDLINGSGLTAREAAEEVEWGAIVDRVPLMVYLGELVDERLKELSANDKSVESDGDEITRLSETVAVISDVMVGSGMADSTDSDYQGLALRMKTAALAARDSVTRKDAAGFNSAVGAMKQSCDACHEQYR